MKRIVILFGILLSFAFWLRWRYVQDISLYVDEFTTLWAARRVQQTGIPLMPSGVIYTRGLLAAYVEAAFLTVFGFSYTVGRLPSVIFGLGAILMTFVLGQRIWNWRVGWLAAVGLTLLPEAIIWGGRARFYTQLQFFVLLMVWAAFAVITAPYPSAGSPESKSKLSRGTLALLFAFFFHPGPLFPGRDDLALSIDFAGLGALARLA